MKLNLYGVMANKVEFASASYVGIVSISRELWHEMGEPFTLEVSVPD